MGEVAQPPAVPLFVQEVEEGNTGNVLPLDAHLPSERGVGYDLGQVIPRDSGGRRRVNSAGVGTEWRG